MNIARWFSAYRLLEDSLAREQLEVARLRLELQEWQDKVLLIKGVTPIYQPPSKIESLPQPPIGISAKRRQIASVPNDEPPTAEQILDAAARAKAASG